jgi:8-oxo-dGTP diphosphatase
MRHDPGYPTPRVTADLVALAGPAGARRVLLVLRAGDPFAGSWALPGGFVEEYEPLEIAAARELAEETGIDLAAPPTRIVGVYGGRGRDPRGWTVTVAYLADLGRGEPPRPTGGDDAAQARWWPVEALPVLAFDHDRIVADALAVSTD